MGDTRQRLLRAQSGGNGYLLKNGEVFDATEETGNFAKKAMNIDWVNDTGVQFSVLETVDENGDPVDLLEVLAAPLIRGRMGIAGETVSAFVRNFTCENGFTKITANNDIWLNFDL